MLLSERIRLMSIRDYYQEYYYSQLEIITISTELISIYKYLDDLANKSIYIQMTNNNLVASTIQLFDK